MTNTKKPRNGKSKSKKGGTLELAPIIATGALYGTALYNKKKGRKMKGGDGAYVKTPGDAVPVEAASKPSMPTQVEPAVGGKAVPTIDMIPADVRTESPAAAAVTGSAAHSPLVAGMLDLSKNSYLGATASSRPAPVDAPGGLLQGGGKKKPKRKQKGGEGCSAMATPIPTNAGAGGDIRASGVVSGAVGGVAGQEEAALVGGAKRRGRKGKKHGGNYEEGGNYTETAEDALKKYEGGAKKRKSKGK